MRSEPGEGPPDRVDYADLGGDPPCWENRIVDHRDLVGPPAAPDLSTPAEIHDLVTIFYREIVFDELLEPVFSGQADLRVLLAASRQPIGRNRIGWRIPSSSVRGVTILSSPPGR